MGYAIRTHRSFENPLLENIIDEKTYDVLAQQRKKVWYKRLWFYFFEQEITADVRTRIAQELKQGTHHLLDPEYQSLMARCTRGKDYSYTSADELTLVVNNYLFGQGEFVEIDYHQADELMTAALAEYMQVVNVDHKVFVSDAILELRRTRADVTIVSQLYEGMHTYQSLHKMCSDYVGTFACFPRFVSYYAQGWSQETIMAAVDDPSPLAQMLVPSYSLEYALVGANTLSPYGQSELYTSPYATWFARMGRLWSFCPWYGKGLASLMVIVLSGWIGGLALVVLPLLWGLLAVARSQWQYLVLLQQLFMRWYSDYDKQHQHYLDLYATMVDPSQETKQTVQAQHLMGRWFDVVPFAGHQLLWEASEYGKQLYQILMTMAQANEYDRQAFAQMNAVVQWSKDNAMSLLIVKDVQFAEQALYRVDALLHAIRTVMEVQDEPILSEHQHYESITELVAEKKYNFWLWTMRNSLRDGMLVAISSGVLGWIGSYLRNRSAGSANVMAAGPSLLAPTLTESEEILFSHDELVAHMQSHMSDREVEQLLQVLNRGEQGTLWDAMVVQFGYGKGNMYTNTFMDAWWRISDDQMTSKLFTLALDDEFPTQFTDPHWQDMHTFLHRIYGYKNLVHYSELLDQPWLSQTLTALSDGSMTVMDFAQLTQEQREIITQALFYHLDENKLQELFQSNVSGISPQQPLIEVQTGATTTGSIQIGGEYEPPLIAEHMGSADQHITLTGESEQGLQSGVDQENRVSLLDQFVNWKQSVGEKRQLRFPWGNGEQMYQNFVNRKAQTTHLRNDLFPWSDWGFFSSEQLSGNGTDSGSIETSLVTGSSVVQTGVNLGDSGMDMVDSILSGLDQQQMIDSNMNAESSLSDHTYTPVTLPTIRKDKQYPKGIFTS